MSVELDVLFGTGQMGQPRVSRMAFAANSQIGKKEVPRVNGLFPHLQMAKSQ